MLKATSPNPRHPWPPCAFHAGGRAAHAEASGWPERLRREQAKLRRRLKQRCRAKHLIGYCRLLWVRRRLLARLRRRFEASQALFLW